MADAIFIFNVHRCAACRGKIEDPCTTWKTTINGVEHRFPFCAACVNGEPTDERCRELVRRMIGVEDALERGDEEQRIRRLLEME